MHVRRLIAGLNLLWLSALPLAALAFTPDLSDLEQIPQRQVFTAAMKSAIVEAKHRPLQYAVAATMSADIRDGSWDEPEAGVARWRLRVSSLGALSMSFGFDSLQLPPEARMWIYTAGGDDVQGPYTTADNGRFSSALVRAEEAVIEARMPTNQRDAFSLTLSRAFHGYLSPFSDTASKSFPEVTNDSGSCQVNTACTDGASWRDEIRSTVLLTIDDSFFCSGTLVNNTRQDNRALILSANHCGVRSNNVTATRAYFNVQKSSCTTTEAGPVTQNIAGRTLLARTPGNTNTDYVLFELQSKPPSNYNVHYAGWDISGSAPQSGVTIHHPRGDDKKISTYTAAARTRDDVSIGSFSVDAWEVNWSRGTTEPGSSGAGLWNQSQRLVGTLSGGNGACGGLLAPASNNGRDDFFARLSLAWNATSDTGSTLKSQLDSNNTGCTALDGKDPNTVATNCAAAALPDPESGGSDGGGALSLSLLAMLGLLAGLRRGQKS